MGIFGTYGAFQGLGKPSIKLEFEDNDELLAFQRRVDGGDGGAVSADPDLANYDQKRLDEAVANHNTIGWGMSDELPDGWTRLYSDAAPDGFDVMVKGSRPELRLGTYGWQFRSASDARLVAKEKKLKATKGGELEGTDEDIIDKLKSLAVSGQYYNGDLSKKDIESEFGKGEPFTIHNNTRLHKYPTPVGIVNFTENNIDKLQSRKRTQYFYLIKPTLLNPLLVFEDRGALVYLKTFKIDGKCIFFVVPVGDYQNVENGVKSAYEKGIEYVKEKIKGGRVRYADPNISSAQLPTLGEATSFIVGLPFEGYTENGAKSCNFNENSLGAPGDTYLVTDTRKKPRKDLDDVTALKKYDIRKLTGEELAKMQKEDPLLYEQIKSDINDVKVTPIKDASKDADELVAVWSKKFRPVRGFDEQKSIAPARAMKEVRDEITQYLVDEVNAGNYEYVRKLANLLGYKYIHNARIAETHSVIEQFATITPTLPEGWQISSAVPKYLPKLPKGFVYIDNGKDGFEYRHKIMPAKKGLGRTANPAIYNNNDIMECRGLVPTYTILDDYSSFFEQAKTHTEFAGFGLDDTLKLITDICRKHWKDCAKIAQHLKGDCKLQSAFNLWHWMRYNIRYEYDREGREEVRTPLRVWADRMRGVDCDCLSVFAYCVLKCMGYNPAFELVAFRNKPQYSHIFINLDGIVVDRVWFIFNSRPPMVTKSTIYRINNINDLGKLF